LRVLGVRPDTEAAKAGFRADDDLIAVDGRPVRDSLDLAFALGCADGETVRCDVVRGGAALAAYLTSGSSCGDLGIDFAPDACRSCGNRCVFCFVDQLPRGLRKSLYVKDEDFRLSFSFGNYITLTNLADDDYARIEAQRLTPLYVSVHATDDAVRSRMLGNPDAPPIVASLRRLGKARAQVHAQIVVCPGMNDGPVLERTLDDLLAMPETVLSIAVVPVGLTAHRQGLPRLEPVAPSLAAALVDAVERRQAALRGERGGGAVVFASDELYLLAGRELPPLESYEDFPQLENGVGLLRRFEADLEARAPALEGLFTRAVTLTILTAPLAAPFLRKIVRRALAAAAPIETRVLAVENTLLGPTVTVAGLIPGRDMARALRDAEPADLTLLPGEAFNEDRLTIDGMTVEEIAAAAGRENVAASHDVVSALTDYAGRRSARRTE
jgi:putative radical SAM enzyme (TIGR03279 family)